MKVELFVPCVLDQFQPETAFSTIKLLEKAGCEVNYNAEQTCCGLPAYNAGFWDDAKKMGSKYIEEFTEESIIVTPSASCVGMVRKGFSDLFTNTTVHNKCRAIQGNIYELSDFLVNILQYEYFGAELEGHAVYHDNCNALRQCKIKDEPRRLLENVHGLELLQLPNADTCCGAGGNMPLNFSAISTAMARQKVDNAVAAGAEYIISTDASCLLHLQSYIDREQLPIKTMHIADVLASGWGNV